MKRNIQFLIVTIVTVSRFIAAPYLIMYMISGSLWKAAFIFLWAAFADALDGFLARRWNVTTPIGANLDPIADKVLIVAAIIALHVTGQLWSILVVIPTLVIITRELFMLGVPLWRLVTSWRVQKMRALEQLCTYNKKVYSTRPEVTKLGKVKMQWQCYSIFVFVAVLCVTDFTPVVLGPHGELSCFSVPGLGAALCISESQVSWITTWVIPLGTPLWWLGVLAYWYAGYLTFVTGLDYLGKTIPRLKSKVAPIIKLCWIPAPL